MHTFLAASIIRIPFEYEMLNIPYAHGISHTKWRRADPNGAKAPSRFARIDFGEHPVLPGE